MRTPQPSASVTLRDALVFRPRTLVSTSFTLAVSTPFHGGGCNYLER